MSKIGSETKPLSVSEKIARLRATFLTQLPERIVRAQALFWQIKADPADHSACTDLHRHMHSLKGTGCSFGFNELGEAAGQCEALAAVLLDMPAQAPPVGWEKTLASCLDHVAMLATILCTPEGSKIGEDGSVYSLPTPAEQSGTINRGRLVYICDDEALTLEQLAVQLACFGYQIETFTDSLALHAAVLKRRPDALIMDINFPQGHCAGTEVLAALSKETEQVVPAIFLSARDDFAARLGAVQAGGQAYFHKPARALDLVAVLDELTGQHEATPFRILVIDDEAEVGAYHSILLQEAGMLTQQLNDPASIIDVLMEFHPDLILMDMYMPQCNGYDLAKLIRQLPDYLGLPIVYLSSETDRNKQFSAMRVGAEDFLIKPVVPVDLVAAVAIRAERMRTLRSLMARDSLTGLFNHTTTTQLLENAIATAKRNGGELCFAMLDVDHFKLVNDTYGHPVGDQVLLALSRILQQRLRSTDIVGRYGGEEFAVILPNVSSARAAQLIDKLRQDFNRLVFHSANGDFSCAFSAGISSYPAHQRVEMLREAADKALYAAKNNGRNLVMVD
jgi:diguanylate cyclase (GGDEF)-like protein